MVERYIIQNPLPFFTWYTYIYSLPVKWSIEMRQCDGKLLKIAKTEDEGKVEEERRLSFTINSLPYSLDIDTAGGESGNATFTADQAGIFQYYCKYRLPTMRALPVVFPPSSSPGESPQQCKIC